MKNRLLKWSFLLKIVDLCSIQRQYFFYQASEYCIDMVSLSLVLLGQHDRLSFQRTANMVVLVSVPAWKLINKIDEIEMKSGWKRVNLDKIRVRWSWFISLWTSTFDIYMDLTNPWNLAREFQRLISFFAWKFPNKEGSSGGVGVLGGGGVGLFVAVDDETERFSSKHVSDRSLNRFINRLT